VQPVEGKDEILFSRNSGNFISPLLRARRYSHSLFFSSSVPIDTRVPSRLLAIRIPASSNVSRIPATQAPMAFSASTCLEGFRELSSGPCRAELLDLRRIVLGIEESPRDRRDTPGQNGSIGSSGP